MSRKVPIHSIYSIPPFKDLDKDLLNAIFGTETWGVWKNLWGQIDTPLLAVSAVTSDILADLAVVAGKIGEGAVNVLDIIVDGLFSIAGGGRNKFENLFVNTALIDNLAVTSAKINDLAVTTAKIDNLAVTTAKIQDLAVETAKIAALAVTNAKISNLEADRITADRIYSGDVMANRLSASHLRTDVAIVTQSLQISDLIVTSGKLATTLGIKSSELPVMDPNSYSTQSESYVEVSVIKFEAIADIKHRLEECTVWMMNTGAITYLKVEYSINNGSSWTQFGAEQSETSTSMVKHTITDVYSTALDTPFWVRFLLKTSYSEYTAMCKWCELSKRKFLGKRTDI